MEGDTQLDERANAVLGFVWNSNASYALFLYTSPFSGIPCTSCPGKVRVELYSAEPYISYRVCLDNPLLDGQ